MENQIPIFYPKGREVGFCFLYVYAAKAESAQRCPKRRARVSRVIILGREKTEVEGAIDERETGPTCI